MGEVCGAGGYLVGGEGRRGGMRGWEREWGGRGEGKGRGWVCSLGHVPESRARGERLNSLARICVVTHISISIPALRFPRP